jgi:Cu/Ag efflux pump CusA
MTDNRDRDEALQKLAHTQAKLSRHERWTAIILAILTVAAVVALGLLIRHVAGLPWLSHPR